MTQQSPEPAPRPSTPARSQPDGKRTTSLILGWIALVPMSVALGSLIFIVLTAHGPSVMAGVLPLFAIQTTGWIWALLAVIALLIARDARRPGLPYLISIIALAQAVIGILVTLPR